MPLWMNNQCHETHNFLHPLFGLCCFCSPSLASLICFLPSTVIEFGLGALVIPIQYANLGCRTRHLVAVRSHLCSLGVAQYSSSTPFPFRKRSSYCRMRVSKYIKGERESVCGWVGGRFCCPADDANRKQSVHRVVCAKYSLSLGRCSLRAFGCWQFSARIKR